MKSVSIFIAVILDAASAIANLALLVFILALVLTRYVLGWSVVGLDELALLAAIWLYMLGGIVASRRGEHLVVDFLPQSLTNPRAKRWHSVLVSAISVLILCFFTYWAYRLIEYGIKRPQTTSSLNLPQLLAQSAIMAGAAGCLFYALRDLFVSVSELLSPAAQDRRPD